MTATHLKLIDIGDTVTYVRIMSDGAVRKGNGIVRAKFVDSDMRLAFLLRDPELPVDDKTAIFNVFAGQIGLTPEEQDALVLQMQALRAYDEAKSLEETNFTLKLIADCKEEKTKVFGAPIEGL